MNPVALASCCTSFRPMYLNSRKVTINDDNGVSMCCLLRMGGMMED